MNRKEQLSCLTDRPCAVCRFHNDNGCNQWKCVFEEQPCEDAISRQAAIEIIQGWIDHDMGYSWEEKNIMRCAIVELEDLPSVSTEKTGRWKRVSIDKYIQHAMAYYKCSECGGQTIGRTEYCPNCGAKMVEPQESEE